MKKTFLLMLLASVLFGTARSEKANRGYPRVMNGPMIGAVTDIMIPIWVRMNGPYRSYVVFDTDSTFASPDSTVARKALSTRDFTIVHKLLSLQPNTTYYYRIHVEERPARYLKDEGLLSTKTAPALGTRTQFSVGFGSCARYQEDRLQPVWNAVSDVSPDLFLWLGDNIYGDSELTEFLAEEYRRQRDVASLQPVIRSVPQLAIWDDHDYGLNDHDRTHPKKDAALQVFRNYWANPAYGTVSRPGVYFQYDYGGVDFFFLDGRYYRDPNAMPDTPEKTQLGEKQLEWLKEGLRRSRSPFKVIASAGGWSLAKGEGGDSWSAFVHERDSLFAFIAKHEIAGVVLLSGDTHAAELNAIPKMFATGYDLYDMTSSPLAQGPSESWKERHPEVRIRRVYNEDSNFAELTFDLEADDPVLTYRLYNTKGEETRDPLVIKASELQPGMSTWREKISKDLLPGYAEKW